MTPLGGGEHIWGFRTLDRPWTLCYTTRMADQYHRSMLYDDDERIAEMDRELRSAHRLIARLQGAMRVAGNYRAQPSEGEDELSVMRRQIEGMQAALLKGSEEAFRPNGKKRHRDR